METVARNDNEDNDNDNDSVINEVDLCKNGITNWRKNSTNDNDGDGCIDQREDNDDDNDGFSDIIDFCPLQEGTATQGGMKGCPDFDEDGWADTADAFFQDETQWSDGDGDGFGDNPAGNNPDDCPFFFGNSSMDRIGCIDSDGDGYSDPEIAWSVAQGADAFVDEPTQWADADGDGYGDNFEGVTVDFCTNDAGTSSIDRFGCPDLDGDGYSDPDAFWTYNKWNPWVMDLICSLSTPHSGLIQTTMVLVITGVTQNGTNLGMNRGLEFSLRMRPMGTVPASSSRWKIRR